ncbi:hypothetical protein J2790_002190 [Paenarthrobacter nicotinovorans]|nr:hypothetical protein [Paenarthrobacter nicotinovorans]SCZ54732.1 hypothetical protein SAMN02799638_01569 [Arthrobacter sp. UNCCL28]
MRPLVPRRPAVTVATTFCIGASKQASAARLGVNALIVSRSPRARFAWNPLLSGTDSVHNIHCASSVSALCIGTVDWKPSWLTEPG